MANDKTGFRLPGVSHQVSVIGHNGSGKTHLSTWLLSHANWTARPWLIVDFKLEPLFHDIQRMGPGSLRELSLDSTVPRKPGLYIVRPRPNEKDHLDEFLWRIWARGKTGLYVDEAHMMPLHPTRHGAFQAILTQGRSKEIPRIVVTQKPSWVSPFVFSEANFYALFYLQDWRDKKRVLEFVPIPDKLEHDLPEYHSYWHDAGQRRTYTLHPVGDRDSILNRFRNRLATRGSKWNAFTSLGQSKTGLRWF